METRWWYIVGNEKRGPATSKVLRQMLADGEIAFFTLVSQEGSERWAPAIDVKELIHVPTGKKTEHKETALEESARSACPMSVRQNDIVRIRLPKNTSALPLVECAVETEQSRTSTPPDSKIEQEAEINNFSIVRIARVAGWLVVGILLLLILPPAWVGKLIWLLKSIALTYVEFVIGLLLIIAVVIGFSILVTKAKEQGGWWRAILWGLIVVMFIAISISNTGPLCPEDDDMCVEFIRNRSGY